MSRISLLGVGAVSWVLGVAAGFRPASAWFVGVCGMVGAGSRARRVHQCLRMVPVVGQLGWVVGCVFACGLNGCEFESCCSHLVFFC